MDTLYYKVFNNLYLNNYIFGFIKGRKDGLGYKQLEEIGLFTIFNNRKLFLLKYQSYLYYNKDKSVFKDLYCVSNQASLLFQSQVITFEEFLKIYNEFKGLNSFLRIQKKKILEWACLNESIGKEMILHLLTNESFQFQFNDFHHVIYSMCSNEKTHSLELLEFVLECFKNSCPDHNDLIQLKTLTIQALHECINNKKVNYYKTIFEMCINSIVDLEGNDVFPVYRRPMVSYKVPNYIISERNRLLQKVVSEGSFEVAELYIDKFPNQISLNQESIVFNNFKNEESSFRAYTILVLNKTLFVNIHEPFINLTYLENISVDYFKPLIEFSNYCIGNSPSIEVKEISKVKDTKTLKYLIENKNKLYPKNNKNNLICIKSIIKFYFIFKYFFINFLWL